MKVEAAPYLAAAATGPIVSSIAGAEAAVLSVCVGLLGVFLARTVFVDRENRRLQRRQTWRETMPVTGTAMLIAGVWIWDAKPSLSMAAFTGLGVGWVAVLLLDIIGKRVADSLRALLGVQAEEVKPIAPPAPGLPAPVAAVDHEGGENRIPIPADMVELVDRIDEADLGRAAE